MAKHESVPPGHVLIRLDDLAALLAAARPPDAGQPVQPTPPVHPPDAGTTAWPALAVAISLITNRLGASGAVDADLIGDVPAETIIGALAAIAARAMSCAYPMPVVQQVLRDLGMAVAREASGGE